MKTDPRSLCTWLCSSCASDRNGRCLKKQDCGKNGKYVVGCNKDGFYMDLPDKGMEHHKMTTAKRFPMGMFSARHGICLHVTLTSDLEKYRQFALRLSRTLPAVDFHRAKFDNPRIDLGKLAQDVTQALDTLLAMVKEHYHDEYTFCGCHKFTTPPGIVSYKGIILRVDYPESPLGDHGSGSVFQVHNISGSPQNIDVAVHDAKTELVDCIVQDAADWNRRVEKENGIPSKAKRTAPAKKPSPRRQK